MRARVLAGRPRHDRMDFKSPADRRHRGGRGKRGWRSSIRGGDQQPDAPVTGAVCGRDRSAAILRKMKPLDQCRGCHAGGQLHSAGEGAASPPMYPAIARTALYTRPPRSCTATSGYPCTKHDALPELVNNSTSEEWPAAAPVAPVVTVRSAAAHSCGETAEPDPATPVALPLLAPLVPEASVTDGERGGAGAVPEAAQPVATTTAAVATRTLPRPSPAFLVLALHPAGIRTPIRSPLSRRSSGLAPSGTQTRPERLDRRDRPPIT